MKHDDAVRARLRELWTAEPRLSTAEIGRRMRPPLTKNSVVGLADRMGLPGRESPIARNGKPAAPVAHRAPSLAEATALSATLATLRGGGKGR